MFGNQQYLKFNSKQPSTWDLEIKISQLFKLRKEILLVDKSNNHVLYCVTSKIWQQLQHGTGLRQGQWKGEL